MDQLVDEINAHIDKEFELLSEDIKKTIKHEIRRHYEENTPTSRKKPLDDEKTELQLQKKCKVYALSKISHD